MSSDLASAIAADQAAIEASEAEELLGSLIQPEQYVGEVFAISYETALVQVHDFHRQKVGGIPATCFLVASRITGAASSIDYTQEDSSVILLRVLDAAPLPSEQEVVRLKAEAAQRASGEDKHWDAPDVVDVSMHQLMSFAGVKCRVLGTFYLDANSDGHLALRFGSDISNFYPSKGLKVFKPNKKALERIVNFRDPSRDQAYFANEVTLGEVRYASTNRAFQGITSVVIRMNPADLLGQKTALFGMTRVGKSNATKVLAKTVFDLRPSYRVGQLIFDPNGEYANENVQDSDGHQNPSALKNVWRQHGAGAQNDVVTFGLQPHPSDPDRRLMRLNFHADATLQVGKEIINGALAVDASLPKYIANFIDVRFDEPAAEDQGEMTRFRRRVLAYRALLAKAGFHPPKSLVPQTKGLFNKKLLDAMQGLEDKFAFAAEALASPKSWEQVAEALEILRQFMADDHYRAFENAYMDDARKEGKDPRPWADELLKKILGMFEYANGPKVVGRVLQQHTDTLTADYAVDIYKMLEAGKLVIVDQSAGDETINRSSAERIMWSVFRQNQARFRFGQTPPNVIVYTEEAHTLLPHGSEEDLTNVWVRTAKEGAKYNIAMVYSTQEPSSVQKNIMKNTVNWFLGHLNNTDETKELRKFYDFGDFEASILRAQDKGFLRMKTLSNVFTVPVQVVRFQV